MRMQEEMRIRVGGGAPTARPLPRSHCATAPGGVLSGYVDEQPRRRRWQELETFPVPARILIDMHEDGICMRMGMSMLAP